MNRTDQLPAHIGDDDAPQHRGEARLVDSTIVSRSHVNRSVAHELPRILQEPGVRYAARPDDAAALLRLVEEQARDLVKLRRALVGANSLAEERLKIIDRTVVPFGGRSGKALTSRSRKILRKVGKLPRKLRRSTKDLRRALGSVGRILGRGNEAELVISPTEQGPFGARADKINRYESMIQYSTREFVKACRSCGTDVIIDIGANRGQFVQSLRACGYTEHIISFEPLSDAHAQLGSAAANDALWDVVERCAVGAVPGEAQINIAGNSYSSSLLPMLDRHALAAPNSVYQGAEACHVIALDDYIESTFCDPTVAFGLKIDTQGYEAQVLKGARRNFTRIKVIMCEMSLIPLYEGAPIMPELCRMLADSGYRCVAVAPEFEDPRTGELLQVNGIFVRR